MTRERGKHSFSPSFDERRRDDYYLEQNCSATLLIVAVSILEKKTFFITANELYHSAVKFLSHIITRQSLEKLSELILYHLFTIPYFCITQGNKTI